MSLKIAIIAGEPSGDLLAADLIRLLKTHAREPIEFMGIGGMHMANEGFISFCNMDILSVGGYGLDVLMAIPRIYWLFRQVTQAIIEFKPDVFIGVDAPDFNFHVEKKLKQQNIRTIHYISPTIWAWRYERIYKIKQTTDFMLCIFPMEEAIYKHEAIPAKFVGNPLANQIELDIDTGHYRNKLSIDLSATVFTVLVGSRKAELKQLSAIFIEACSLIAKELPHALFLFPLAKESTYKLFKHYLKNSEVKFNYQVLNTVPGDAIKAADLVLAKSGTVTLEVALSKKPLVVSYKVAKLTEWIIKRKIKINYVAQPNILLNEEVAPELLQNNATAENIAQAMLELFFDKARQEYVIGKFYQLHQMLKTTANNNAGLAVLDFIAAQAK
jgi:lipid-A-disaccharide synthase